MFVAMLVSSRILSSTYEEYANAKLSMFIYASTSFMVRKFFVCFSEFRLLRPNWTFHLFLLDYWLHFFSVFPVTHEHFFPLGWSLCIAFVAQIWLDPCILALYSVFRFPTLPHFFFACIGAVLLLYNRGYRLSPAHWMLWMNMFSSV